MASAGPGEDGWHLVAAHPATEIREEKQIEEWEQSKGHWSGVGKHPANWSEHKTLRVQERVLGEGSYGTVERITYRTVTMARKHLKPRHLMTVEKLREEATVMERLAHKHILKLVGTYTLRGKSLYLLLYPVAVCDLSRLLEDIDEIRSGTYADRDDAFQRLRLLGLKEIGTIDDLPNLRDPIQPAESNNAPSRTATAVGFLQQTLGCITEALAFVHEKDIRHRDLKPKNILLSPGRIHLADFGVARDVRETEDSITSGRYGTPSWIAPEVHDEQDHHMSPADIWSLGCIFLNIVTVLYGEGLESYEVMKERDWTKKYDMLPKYLKQLASKATAAGFEHHEAPNFNVKHVIGLIEDMLKHNPDERPTAIHVNARLSELGGLDQVYYLPCCHKKSNYVSQAINKKLKSIHDTNVTSLLQLTQLKAQNDKLQERLDQLEKIHSTYEQRIENERKHAGEQYRVLKEKYDREVESRKALEDRIKELEFRQPRRPGSQNRGRGRGQGTMHANGHSTFNGNGNMNKARDSGVNNTALNFHRRTSRVPLPIRPSTPIRPSYNREPGSNSSTIVSSVHSTFSRTSLKTNESFSSVESSTMRSLSPESPTTARPPVSPVIDTKLPASPVLEKAKTSLDAEKISVPKPSWANMVARSASRV